MLQGNEREIKRMLEERKDILKAKVKKTPNNYDMLEAHERKELNIYAYVDEINDVLNMLNSTEYDVYLADKRSLEKEKAKAFSSELISGEFVEVWEISVYNKAARMGGEYYVVYCTPMSNL